MKYKLFELKLLIKYYKVVTFNFQLSINTLNNFINYNYQKLGIKKFYFKQNIPI